MSYEPLHHKYRPQTFAQLVGQEAIAQTLSNALKSDRIAPAYLFTGARGTGKTSSARILAKSLNCLTSNGPTDAPCGQCDLCHSITKGSALDVIEIDAASNTGVDNIREIIERAQFAPVQCRYKVYVIDECHMLSTAAFNALLKTLEEPPKHVVFVLATTDPQRVLPTIISRCQRFDFRRIPLTAMVGHLRKIADLETIEVTDEAVQLVAQISQGGLRDAESLLDQLSLLTPPVTVDSVWDLVGAVPERDLLAMLQAIVHNDAIKLLERARNLLDRGREPIIVLQNLAAFYRDLLLAKTAPQRPDLVAITSTTWQQLQCFQGLEISQILHGQQHLKSSESQIRNSTQPRLWLEVTLLGLLPSNHPPASPPATMIPVTSNGHGSRPPSITPPPQPPVEPPGQKNGHVPQAQIISPTPNLPESSPVAVQVETPPPKVETAVVEVPVSPPVETVVPAIDLDQLWQQVLPHIQPPTAHALLKQHGRILSYQENAVRVGLKTDPLLRMVKGKEKNIEQAFSQALNVQVRVTLEVGTVPVAVTSASPAQTPVPPTPVVESPVIPPPPPETVPPAPTPVTPPAVVSQPVVEEKPVVTPAPKPVVQESVQVVYPVVTQPVEERIPEPSNGLSSQKHLENNADPEVVAAAQRIADLFKGDLLELSDRGLVLAQTSANGTEPALTLDSLQISPEESSIIPEEEEEEMPF